MSYTFLCKKYMVESPFDFLNDENISTHGKRDSKKESEKCD